MSLQSVKEVLVPDIGNYKDVEVIDVSVSPGDMVEVDDALITLETDKAAMEVPSPFAGRVREVKTAVGARLSKGGLIVILDVEQNDSPKAEAPAVSKTATIAAPVITPEVPQVKESVEPVSVSSNDHHIYASPLIRRLAREFGVDLSKVAGTGRKGRLSKEDVQNYVKEQLARPAGGGGGLGFDLPPMADIDFSQFGEVVNEPLSRIKKLSAGFLHRNWISIPHVTQFDEVDITEMENFRNENKKQAESRGFKLTPLIFLLKAAVVCLKVFPHFNASLSKDGTSLHIKKYYHIGVAVNTENGLVVPVIRDVDQKGLLQLAQELAQISDKARAGKLTSQDMQGSCFSISSLGGIGGTAFTPIINAPDVAILGVSKSQMKPIYQSGQFVPRLMLPLSLSYDHRVIDGAEAAQFITLLGEQLADIRRILL